MTERISEIGAALQYITLMKKCMENAEAILVHALGEQKSGLTPAEAVSLARQTKGEHYDAALVERIKEVQRMTE